MNSVLGFLLNHVGAIMAVGFLFCWIILPLSQWLKGHKITIDKDLPTAFDHSFEMRNSATYSDMPGNSFYHQRNR